MSTSKQIADWNSKKFGRAITEEELEKRTHPAWPYIYLQPGPNIDPEVPARLLNGAIELHTHGAPAAWLEGRSNYFDTAIACSEAGYKAVVFKDQDTQTCSMAGTLQRGLDIYAQEKAKQGVDFKATQVFGGIVLDKSVGGMNLHAVDKALSYGNCKLVWLPCQDAGLLQECLGHEENGIFVSDLRGNLTSDMIKLLEMMSEYNSNSEGKRVSLSTCHVTNEEKIDIARYVQKRGLNVKVMHDHITQELTLPLEDEYRAMLEAGSYVQFCSNSMVPWARSYDNILTIDYCINMVKNILKDYGPSHCILVTDAGLPGYDEVPALQELIVYLLKNGISEADVKVMCQDAPAEVIGL